MSEISFDGLSSVAFSLFCTYLQVSQTTDGSFSGPLPALKLFQSAVCVTTMGRNDPTLSDWKSHYPHRSPRSTHSSIIKICVMTVACVLADRHPSHVSVFLQRLSSVSLKPNRASVYCFLLAVRAANLPGNNHALPILKVFWSPFAD